MQKKNHPGGCFSPQEAACSWGHASATQSAPDSSQALIRSAAMQPHSRSRSSAACVQSWQMTQPRQQAPAASRAVSPSAHGTLKTPPAGGPAHALGLQTTVPQYLEVATNSLKRVRCQSAVETLSAALCPLCSAQLRSAQALAEGPVRCVLPLLAQRPPAQVPQIQAPSAAAALRPVPGAAYLETRA